MAIHQVEIISTDITFLQNSNTPWSTTAAGPASSTTTNGGLNTQTVSDDADGTGNELITQAAFSFDTSNLLTRYGAAMEITAATFSFEVVTSVWPGGSWGLVGYYNHFTTLDVNDWVNPPPSETTAWSQIILSDPAGVTYTPTMSSPDTNIQKSGTTGFIVVSSGISNNVAPSSDYDANIATSAHATGDPPTLIMTIDDNIPATSTFFMGASF